MPASVGFTVDFRPNCLPDLLEDVGKHLSNVGIDIRQARDELTGTNLIMIVSCMRLVCQEFSR